MASSTSRMLYVLIALSFFAKASRADRIFNIELKGVPPQSYRNLSSDGIPDEVDWRKEGAVTPIKNQGNFGTCFAFGVVAAIEGITKISKKKLISLSEQQVIDCSGCKGEARLAFEYIIKKRGEYRGLISEDEYPYTGKAGTCKDRRESAATINGYASVQKNDESALRKAVARQPILVRIAASHSTFREYKGGVYKSAYCGAVTDHSVIVVGYGTEGRDKYWLIKNYWGTGWGEGGYMKMKRDVGPREGLCGIATDPSYPTV